MKRRVVVTGLGAVTPIGNTVDEFWSSIREGKVGIGEITKFDTTDYKVKIAAEVKGFVAKERMDFKASRRMEPFSQYAVAAAKEAYEDAGLDISKEDPYRAGVIIGSGIGSLQEVEKEYEKIQTKGPSKVNPLMVPLMIETMAKKLEEVSGLPDSLVKRQIFGKQFHTICSGGAYLPPAMIDLFNRYGITILQGYGMTECSPVISTTVSWNIRKESVGQLLPNCEAKTVDEELWVRGSSVMLGYYKMPEETAEALEDGWLKTGDLGYADEEGFVYLTGRKKNLIITKNGENVSPEELENKIGENRLVQEILVREQEGVIEAEIFPDYDYAKKKHIRDIRAALQQILDEYNQGAPVYKRVYSLKVRETEFEKNTSRKIKRY